MSETKTPLSGQMRAQFSLVRHATQFVEHLTNGDPRTGGGPAAWCYVPGSLKQDGKTVTWQWAGDRTDRGRYLEYLGDLLETVGAFGVSDKHRASLNGHAASREW